MPIYAVLENRIAWAAAASTAGMKRLASLVNQQFVIMDNDVECALPPPRVAITRHLLRQQLSLPAAVSTYHPTPRGLYCPSTSRPYTFGTRTTHTRGTRKHKLIICSFFLQRTRCIPTTPTDRVTVTTEGALKSRDLTTRHHIARVDIARLVSVFE